MIPRRANEPMVTLQKRKPGEFNEEYILSKAERDYETGEASIRINPKTAALIVVDMVDEFTKPNMTPSWIPDSTKQLAKIRDLIETCRSLSASNLHLLRVPFNLP